MEGDVRASDREREAAVLRLRASHLEGRLEVEDLEERIARVQVAVTRGELDALQGDLPALPHEVPETTGRLPRRPGRRPFAERKVLGESIEAVREAALAHLVPPLESHGYLLAHEREDLLVFAARRGREEERITVRLRPAADGRTLLLARGTAPLRIRRAFARMHD